MAIVPNQTAALRLQVLEEIRKITAESGKPPGRRTFEVQSGIRESEWRGVLWARWGDALLEAGFSPNQKQGRIERSLLLEKLAQSFRHYGRIPTIAEIRMYRQIDAGFPSHSTIDSHFPTKNELLEHLRSWLAVRNDYEDVSELLPSPVATPPIRARANKSEGSVYLIKSGAFYKIGRSEQIERRVKEIRIALPETATLVHVIRTDDPSGIESYWHRRFADHRANGEWFKLSAADVGAFKRRKFQ